MQWILLFLGGAFALIIDQSFTSFLIGGFFGSLIGYSYHLQILTSKNKELANKLMALTNQVQQNQQATAKQITIINKKLFFNISDNDSSMETTSVQTAKESVLKGIVEQSNATTSPSPTIIKKTNPIIETESPLQTPQYQKEKTTPQSQSTIVNKPTTQPIEENITTQPRPIIQNISRQNQQPEKITVQKNTTPTIKRASPSPITKPAVKQTNEQGLEKLFNTAYSWIIGGNTILKIGAITLFLGLAFLLRYATEGMTFPIEGRYIGVAMGGLALIGLGWHLRNALNNYGLILQGTGIGILYLTCYAAMYLHHLLPANTVFILLVIITIFSAFLAISQDTISLAVAASLGGFAAPILASSGGGSHIALFNYFILLNAGILSIAWFKAWRPLNLIGFIGTFGIGFSWGLQSYTPDLFWSTEPFLIIFFLMYITIGLLFVRRKLYDAEHAPQERDALLRWSIRQTDYIDATVVFGAPIVGFGLQYALINDIEYGAAISAFILGIFYLIQSAIFYKFGTQRISLLTEVNLALGVIFTTLSIPLAAGASWTSASWAVEGAGIYWVSLRQQRKIGRLFATCLQLIAAITFITEIDVGNQTLLKGSALGALILGISLLFSFFQARKHYEELELVEQKRIKIFCIAGMSFLYLIPCFFFMQQVTAIIWAIAGGITLWLGQKKNILPLFNYGFIMQILAGFLFITGINPQQLGTDYYSNWQQLILCILLGSLLVSNTIFSIKNEDNQALRYKINLSSLLGLFFINLSALFVLPWHMATNIWAISGVITIALALRLNLLLPFYFSLALQAFASFTFIGSHLTTSANATPFLHINFVTPILLSVMALFSAWRIYLPSNLTISTNSLQQAIRLLLVWGMGLWGFTFTSELIHITSNASWLYSCLLIMISFSLLLAGIIANRYKWKDLALSTCLLIPLTFGIYICNFQSIFSQLGWLSWGIVFAAHLFNLKRLNSLIPDHILSICHILGIWLLIAVLSSGLYQLLTSVSAINTNAWYWLVWMIIPSIWLLLTNYQQRLPWPISSFPKEYCFIASFPIAVTLLIWFWLANIFNTGTIPLIPYIPLLNPLELGLLLSLTSVTLWLSKYLHEFIISDNNKQYFIKLMLGVSLFAFSTTIVFRTAYHWADVPFHFDEQMHSMIVQASLSILWTTIALVLMIVGHSKAYRWLWLIGACLIAVVVTKLFFVELSNSGSLARIISFTIVGVLLLIVGYFAPLPPKWQER